MKKLMIILMVVVLTIGLTGCVGEPTADMVQAEQTEALMLESNNQIGLPNIKNFHEKKMLKEIYELRDDASLVTYTYTTALDGKKIFQFKSIGYGLPMSVQYSNPQRFTGVMTKEVVNDGGKDFTWDYMPMPQAEPNGLFMPEGLSATWVMRILDDGSVEPVYMEETITVSQTKLDKRLCADWSLPADY